VSKIEAGQQELDETSYWLELLVDSGIVPAGRLEALRKEADELMAIFVTSARTAKKHK
jgi:four helix bundle protein